MDLIKLFKHFTDEYSEESFNTFFSNSITSAKSEIPAYESWYLLSDSKFINNIICSLIQAIEL
jgi:hypothetical protein